ncbi:hypothetical protein [Mycoplasma sp. P36-A1]|uniref:hypothetical protein n=1 Tax=Mycoplasma sp. P36-A1 TaxID=3252900 RepID=UPI003C2D2B49
MSKKYKFLIVAFLSLILISCSSDEKLTKYDNMIEMSKMLKTTKDNNFKIEINRNNKTDKPFYEITVENLNSEITDISVLAIPNDKKFDVIMPNINVIESVDLSAFYNQKKAIKLYMFTKKDIQYFEVLLQYKMYTETYTKLVKVAI